MHNHSLFALLLIFMLSACSSDNSDETLSNLCIELADLKTTSSSTVVGCTLDDGTEAAFETPITLKWASKPDSAYRALIYYNKVEETGKIRPISASSVICVRPMKAEEVEWRDYRDPLDFVSAWMSKHGRYVNMCVSLKTGPQQNDKAHKMSAVCDSVRTTADRHHSYYRLCHSQNGIPAYYGVEVYVSLDVSDIPKGDTVTVSMPTFNGMVSKQFVK